MVDEPTSKSGADLPARNMKINRTNLPPTRQATMTVKLHSNLPDTHPFYAAVGRIASEWSHLEHELDLTIWKLAKVGAKAGACITSQIMGVGPRCKAILTLGTMRGLSPKLRKKYRTLMGESYAVADDRARAIHDPWYGELYSGQAAQFRAMPYSDPRFGIMDISESDLDQTLKNIRKLQLRARALMTEVEAELGTSRGKPA
jgi:hypothetical protein